MANAPTGIAGLAAVAKAAGITKVYWIDDQFSSVGPQIISAIRARVYGLLSVEAIPEHAAFTGTTFTQIADDDDKKIHDILKAGKPGLGHELLLSMDSQVCALTKESATFSDLTTAQVDLIANALGPVDRMSFAEWQSKKDSILASTNDGVLFLIDHDFSLEEGCTRQQGRDILKPLIADPAQRCFCILFTQGVILGKEHEEREQLAKDMNVSAHRHRFSVVGKEHIKLPATGGEAPLAKAFQDAFVREWCHLMIEATQKIFTEALETTKSDFSALTFDEISTAFFHRSADDGISEFEVMVRVMMLAGRVALEDSKSTNAELWKKVGRVRDILGAGHFPSIAKPKLSGHLVELRSREIWDPPVFINELYSPPACGDVYEHTSKKTRYVLVGQPCHLAIRGDGKRDHSEALFLEVGDRQPADGKGYKFEFPTGAQWIDFVKAYPVNLYLLDLASFNSSGELALAAAAAASPLMLPGVRLHFDKFRNALASYSATVGLKARFRRLSINEDICKGETKVEAGKKIKLPFTRIGRIRSPHAEAILGGLAVCHTRMAFDYDFSKEDTKAPETTGAHSTPAETAEKPADAVAVNKSAE